MRDVRRPGRSPVSTASARSMSRCGSRSGSARSRAVRVAALLDTDGGPRLPPRVLGAASGWPGPPGAQSERRLLSEGTAGGSMAPAPPATLGAPGLSKTAEPCSAARELMRPGSRRCAWPPVGPWRPGERPGGAASRSPPGRARRFLWAGSPLDARQRSRRSASRSGQPRLPAPSRLAPARRLSAPPPPRSGPVGGSHPRRALPAPRRAAPAGREPELGSLQSSCLSRGAHGYQEELNG